MKRWILILGMGVAVTGVAGTALAGAGHGHKGSHGMSAKQSFSKDAVVVGNKICPVSKQPVDVMGDPVQYEYKGKIYNLCCRMCLRDFKKDPEKFSRVADQEVAAQEDHEGEGEHADEHTGDHDH